MGGLKLIQLLEETKKRRRISGGGEDKGESGGKEVWKNGVF